MIDGPLPPFLCSTDEHFTQEDLDRVTEDLSLLQKVRTSVLVHLIGLEAVRRSRSAKGEFLYEAARNELDRRIPIPT